MKSSLLARSFLILIVLIVTGAMFVFAKSNPEHSLRKDESSSDTVPILDKDSSATHFGQERIPITAAGRQSNAMQPSVELDWWQDERRLAEFYVVFDLAVARHQALVDEVCEKEANLVGYEFENVCPVFSRWLEAAENPEQILKSIESESLPSELTDTMQQHERLLNTAPRFQVSRSTTK